MDGLNGPIMNICNAWIMNTTRMDHEHNSRIDIEKDTNTQVCLPTDMHIHIYRAEA